MTLSPSRVRLVGSAGTPIATTVNIIPKKKHPFKIKNITAKEGKNIKWNMREVKQDQGNGYALKVNNLREKPGRYFDTLTIETDNSDYPKISLRVFGQIFEPRHLNDGKDSKKKQNVEKG